MSRILARRDVPDRAARSSARTRRSAGSSHHVLTSVIMSCTCGQATASRKRPVYSSAPRPVAADSADCPALQVAHQPGRIDGRAVQRMGTRWVNDTQIGVIFVDYDRPRERAAQSRAEQVGVIGPQAGGTDKGPALSVNWIGPRLRPAPMSHALMLSSRPST